MAMFPGARCLLRVRIYTQNKKTFDLIKWKGMEGKRKEYGPVSRGQPLKKSPGAMKTKVRSGFHSVLPATATAWLQQGRLGMEHQNGCDLFTCSLIRSRVASTDLQSCTKDDFGLLMALPLCLVLDDKLYHHSTQLGGCLSRAHLSDG